MHAITLAELYAFLLCFVRILGVFMIIPIFSNRVIFAQAKTTLAALLAIFISPLIYKFLPSTVGISYEMLFSYLIFEFSIGLLIGASGYFLFIVLDFIGHIMGVESGLSNAQLFNPASGQPTELTTNMLIISASVLLFVGDFHHTLIQVIFHSYEHIHLGSSTLIADYHQVILNGLHKMFVLGLQFSFPFILIGLILNLGIGIVNKLIPQIQIFNVMPPAQLIVFFFMLVAVLTSILDGFLNIFKDTYADLFMNMNVGK